MINKSELPKDWEIKKLGEVFTTTSGGTPSRKNSAFYQGNIPWIKSGELDKGLIKDAEEKITEEAIKNSSAKIFPKGTLLIALYGATIGKLAFLGIDAATNQAICGIFENEFYNSKFLYYFLFFKRPSLVKSSIGGAQPNISQTILKDLDLPIPPLADQEHIVAKIEELFSELDAGIESLKTAAQQLKTYRQAVLKWAFEGKLTNENVNEGELPNGWKMETLGNVIEQPKYGTSKKCGYNLGEFGVLRIPNIANGFVDSSDLKFAEFDEKEIETYSLKEGDLLTIRSNGSVDLVGKCALIFKKDEQFLYAGYLIRLRPFAEKINSRFLLYVLWSGNLRNQIESKAKSTSGVNNINSEELKSLVVPVCSLEEQQRIVEEIESRLSVCDKLEETISQSLAQSESLRQSILKQAFEGKLVTQEKAIDYQPQNINFYRIQVLAFMLIYFRRKGFHFAEMTSAKNAYLLDKIFGVPIYENYKRWHLGPYSAEIKKTINNKTYFRSNGYDGIEVLDEEKLFKYPNPYQQKIEDAVNELTEIFKSFTDPKTRSYKIELLATVCKVIEDIQTTEIDAVRQSLEEWKIDLKDKKFNNKAEKFDEKETAKCIEFIKQRGWDKKLIK